MARRDRHRIRPLGVSIVVVGVVVFIALMIARRSQSLFTSMVEVRADFRMITGLRHGSPVQLAGVAVGRVTEIDFVKVEYECDPLTEDVGRYGAGRTNDCDDYLFCSPSRRCADFEPWAGWGYHTACRSSEECAEDEVCITSDFRRRAPKVEWSGPGGVCARYHTAHWRTQVRMTIPEDDLVLIRTDSRATVAANSVLGDQLVNISPGQGDPIGAGARIQTQSSLYEDVERWRHRLDSITENADLALAAILNVINELKDERTIGALKRTIENLDVITRRIAHGDGLVGAMLNDHRYREDLGMTIGALRSTSGGLEHASHTANHILDTADRNIDPLIAEARATITSVDGVLRDLDDPANPSLGARLLRDPDGQLADDLLGSVSNLADISDSASSVAHSIDDGKGTLGLLINDRMLIDDIGHLLHGLATHGLIRTLLLYVLERRGIGVKESRSPAAPPR